MVLFFWRIRALPLLAFILCISPLRGDDLAAKLNLTTASKSLPLWTKPADGVVVDYSAVVRNLHPSIFIIGSSEVGYGTGFVISKEHRMLATNAHVADIMHKAGGSILAISNGTATVFTIDEVFYHPGVRRMSHGLSFRSTDPARGEVDPRSPDVAVMSLADGVELPSALTLAEASELRDLLARPIAMLGFPGHDTTAWPGLGQKAEATFRQGVICRVSDFMNDVEVPAERLQFIQHSMANWFGFSGAPIFLPNGHVIALNNSGRTEKRGDIQTSLAYGVRVDCLWELLKYHQLTSYVTMPVNDSTIDVKRFAEPDKAADKLSVSMKLIAEAEISYLRHDFRNAVAKCNEAVKIAPTYAPAYRWRGEAYHYYATELDDKATKIKYMELSLADAKRALELAPTNPTYYLDLAFTMLDIANVKDPGPRLSQPEVANLAQQIVEQAGLSDADRSYAYRTRALALGFAPTALKDLDQARRADPWEPEVYWDYSLYWEHNGDAAQANRYKAQYDLMQQTVADAKRAWDLATDADATNGREAWRLAAKAAQSTNYKWWEALRALAASYAELGDFNKAVEYAQQTVEIAPEEVAGDCRRQLKKYLAKEPWRAR